jgi:hypothetical protein
MKNQFNRRDFLKLAGVLPLGFAAPRLLQAFEKRLSLQGAPKNVIVIVFDAFSAYDISLYGFPRETTPNIDRLAKRAIVYHNHYAGGNFTTPGTASLLTGVLPWTHRAFQPRSEVADPFVTRNIFGAFQNHYKMAYTHNGWANTLLKQFSNELDELIAREKLMLKSLDTPIQTLFNRDEDIASVSLIRGVKIKDDGYAYSLFLSHLYESLQERQTENLKRLFPRGVPSATAISNFTIEDAVDYVADRLTSVPQPFVGYFHLLPPHEPYRTSQEFYDTFKGDGFKPIAKPIDVLARFPPRGAERRRTEYDEFILYCDREFNRLHNSLERSGLLENTWLVLTSDHGEMFERGVIGHSTDVLYQPVVRIPLMIFEPGRETGMDIFDNTSAVDVLPTLTHLTGESLPDWTEGVVLPPFAPTKKIPDRNVFVMRANNNGQYAPLTQASTMLVRENYKLHYYFGYPEVPADGLVRLFDIKSDPEEMVDLYSSKKGIAAELLNELKTKLKEVDEPYL